MHDLYLPISVVKWTNRRHHNVLACLTVEERDPRVFSNTKWSSFQHCMHYLTNLKWMTIHAAQNNMPAWRIYNSSTTYNFAFNLLFTISFLLWLLFWHHSYLLHNYVLTAWYVMSWLYKGTRKTAFNIWYRPASL